MKNLRSFFKFKNKETEKAILDVLDKYEGIRENDAEKYLGMANLIIKADLFVEAKNTIRLFWNKYKDLPFSDILGLFNMALTDMQQDIIKKGDKFVEDYKKKG